MFDVTDTDVAAAETNMPIGKLLRPRQSQC